jgi:hypothetical protein
MANPTSNFNWQMPTASDLVTDLPADFEVFGQAVDTSLADLKGGTTGQVLKKNSNTDMDFVWGAVDGDIEGVTAGVGISGGGTSGTVTVTNSMATAITTNGDLIYGTGSGTFTRRGIGSTNQVLTVAGGVPTWATPSAAVTSYTLISTTNLAGASSTTVSGLSGYNKLFGAVYNSVASNAGVEVKLRPNNDSAANYFWATGTVRGASSWAATNVSGSGNFVNQSEIDLGGYGSTAASGDLNAYFAIDGANATAPKMITYATGTAGGSGNNHRNYTGWTIYNGTSVISSVNVRITGGTFNAGTLYIWGAN